MRKVIEREVNAPASAVREMLDIWVEAMQDAGPADSWPMPFTCQWQGDVLLLEMADHPVTGTVQFEEGKIVATVDFPMLLWLALKGHLETFEAYFDNLLRKHNLVTEAACEDDAED